ncbi:MAG: MFS transporter, partial [Dehalococcoidia bacterium]|nr:MFS transporter [Dehalococcoidia bacterium]
MNDRSARPPDDPQVEEPAPPPPVGVLGVPRRGWSTLKRGFWAVIPQRSILRERPLQLLVGSRFLTESSQQMLTYAALIALGAESSLIAALIMIATVAPQAMFGLFGGVIADSIPKRLALMLGYGAQAAMCLSVPFLLGDSLLGVLGLIFLVYAVSQISAPAENAIVPLVVDQRSYTAANSWINFSITAGSVFGTVAVAPILVKLFDVRPVFVVAAVFFAIGALRLLALRTPRKQVADPLKLDRQADFRYVFGWLGANRQAYLMLSLGVLAGAANFAMVMLAPRYTAEVLDNDPTNAVYIFWTSGLGLILGLVVGSPIIGVLGSWNSAVFGFGLITASLFLLGVIDVTVTLLDPTGLLTAYKLGFLPITDRMAAAALMALPLGFGITVAGLAAQSYLNQAVPESLQGRVFSVYLVLRNGSAIIPLLAMGLIAEITGVQVVTALAPFLLLGLAIYAARLHARWSRSLDPNL